MSTFKGRSSKPVRPTLAASVSVDAGSGASPAPKTADSGKKPRRHSVALIAGSNKDNNKEADGSLRKVSKWFREFKNKMDPKTVKDKIRYSRSSLVSQVDVAEEEEEEMEEAGSLQRPARTATLGPRKPNKKPLEKRFNSMECLPGSKPTPPTTIRKMNSLQFEAGGKVASQAAASGYDVDEETEASCCSSRGANLENTNLDLETDYTLSERLSRITKEIDDRLEEKEGLLMELMDCQSRSARLRPHDIDSTPTVSKVKTSLLESSYLSNELTRLINSSIRPENLHGRLDTQRTDATCADACPGQPIDAYVILPPKIVDVIDQLHQQLTVLLVAVEENATKMESLREEVNTATFSQQTPDHVTMTSHPVSSSPPRCSSDTSGHSSLSDTECFLSLIEDLGEM